MKWIGLTGGIASGKSSVSQIIRDQGFTVIDADAIAKAVVEPNQPGLAEVVNLFGQEVLKPDGSLDRKLVGQLVFGNPDKLIALEKILHPLVKAETARQRTVLEKSGAKFAFYDVPLLFEKKLEDQFDAIIVVSAGEETQKKRMKKRDALSDQEISSRLASQMKMPHKIAKATWVIENDGGLEDLKIATLDVLRKIQSGKA